MTVKQKFIFISEPRGDVYRDLLSFCAPLSAKMLLVVRPTIILSESGQAILATLDRFGIEKCEITEWPGTRLINNSATGHYFHVSDEVIGVLSSATTRLFSWQQPDLPEDLTLFRHSSDELLSSTSHENYGYVRITADERMSMDSAFPSLGALLQENGTSG